MSEPLFQRMKKVPAVAWFLKELAPQAAAAAILIGFTLGSFAYSSEAEKEKSIPVAFSEIGKIITRHKASGEPLSPLTLYYAKTNDLALQVFDANNQALRFGKGHSTFAKELEMKIDPAFRVHKQIPEYVEEIPVLSHLALAAVSKLAEAQNELPKVTDNLSDLWTESHEDVTHLETSTSCDSKGNCTTTMIEVYDYTIHRYWYDSQAGRLVPALLKALYEKVPDVKIGDRLSLAQKTDVKNEYAIERSMKKTLEGKIPTEEQALQIINVWATGSNYAVFAPQADANYEALRGMANQWGPAMRGAASVTYTTISHSDSGPKEYQFAKRALGYAENVYAFAGKVVNGIRFAAQTAPVLEAKARAYVSVVLDRKPGDADALRDQVMKTSRMLYQNNFERGHDVHPFKWWKVLLAAGLGASCGAGLVWAGHRFVSWRGRDAPKIFKLG